MDAIGTLLPGPRRAARRAAILLTVLLVAPPVGAAVPPSKLDYRQATLANGLTVVTLEDHSAPVFNLQVWYHVGSKNEPPGRTGFAHLFEHLMFKGSKNVEPEQHAAFVSNVGGRSNAYTTDDVTVFWETLPNQYLPLALWLEADRMATLRIDQKNFDSEREVVKEERRLRIENPPYGRLSEIIYANAFLVHPYRHLPIGSMDDLNAATVTDVRAFYDAYYVPNNATVVLVGDFDTAAALGLVEQYLGRVPRGALPVPRDRPAEPPQTAERRVTREEAWPLPAVIAAFHVPADGDPDSYPLHVASKILSDGQSSRIYRRLVYEKKIAVAAFGGGNFTEDPNLFFAAAILNAGLKPADAETELLDELERLKRELISDAELQKAKNQFARDYIVDRESDQDKAGQLGHAVVIHHDPRTADAEFDLFMHVTAADIQRVARKYFDAKNRLVVTIVPKARGAH